MSARLLDQLQMFRRRGRDEGEGPPPAPADPARSSVRRALFGPVDHEENKRFVQEQLQQSLRRASDKWNYDFERDRPREGRFVWEPAAVGAGRDNSARKNEEERGGEKDSSRVEKPAAVDVDKGEEEAPTAAPDCDTASSRLAAEPPSASSPSALTARTSTPLKQPPAPQTSSSVSSSTRSSSSSKASSSSGQAALSSSQRQTRLSGEKIRFLLSP